MPAKQKKVVEITLKTKSKNQGADEILKNLLVNCGLKRDELIETRQNGELRIIGYVFSKQRASRIQKDLSTQRLKQVRINVQTLKNQDWQNAWKDSFHAFALTKAIDVVPLWEKDQYVKKRKEPVYIDTILAFGTGLHETTRFMAKFIEMRRGKLNSFLDVGTGTGILSIIARKHGAKKVHAVDIAKTSIDVAKKNFEANNSCADMLRVCDVAKFKAKDKYDFVAANLITDELIRLKRKLVSLVKWDGYLAISGISRKHYNLVRASFAAFPLRCVKLEKGKLWTAMMFKKAKA